MSLPLLNETLSDLAHAKINLFLNILGPQEGTGFHELVTVFQQIELADELTLKPLAQGRRGCQLHCNWPVLNTPDNLVLRAYEAFYRQAGAEVAPVSVLVTLTKHIPLQAGLGGGSSDAAAMLRLLNQLHQSLFDAAQLHKVASTLGSDVAFFINPNQSVALGSGRGERLQPILSNQSMDLVLIKPKHWGVSTTDAYQWIAQANRYRALSVDPLCRFLAAPMGVSYPTRHVFHNDFEAVIQAHHPELNAISEGLQSVGVTHVHLCGSGPTLWVLDFPKGLSKPWIKTHLPEHDWWVVDTKTRTARATSL